MIQYIAESWPDADLAGWTGPGWYFWDETQSQCIGPYETEEEAQIDAAKYVESL